VNLRTIDVVYRTHGHAVLRRARRLLGDEEEARDLLQEVFASLVARPEQFAQKSSITTWLYGVTTHGCLNRLRNARTRKRLFDEHANPSGARSEPPRAEDVAMVKELLAGLPADLAEVAVYHHIDEMTHDEIAEVLGCSRRHVGDLLTRLRSRVAAEESP
jgi:RNA polymerase sigma-70 factor (ECF subfamily)